jgi:hypothetical protein
MKRCWRCKENKDESAFGIDRSRNDGLMAACKSCRAELAKIKYAKYRAEILEKGRTFYHAKRSEISSRRKELNSKNPDRLKQWRKKHRSENRDKLNEYGRRYYREVTLIQRKDQLWERNRQQKARYALDISFRIQRSVRSAVWRSVMGCKSGHLQDVLGFSVSDLINHLEAQFKDGMTWDNYGDWHIDHKMPVVAFQFKSTADDGFKQAWALSNLQPLWAFENQSKSNIVGGVRVSRNSN